MAPKHIHLQQLSKLVSQRCMQNFTVLDHSMCEYFKLNFKTQNFHRSQWEIVNFSTLKWQIDFKLWYSEDLYDALFYHKCFQVNLE